MSACHETSTTSPVFSLTTGLTVALAGQPNVGKSTVFNTLTGLNQHVGNWPGKTVEQRTGVCQHDGMQMAVVDLPGTYSLTANSQEELIAREYLITRRPEVVVAVVNAAIIERSLYLVAELLALDVPLVIGLNMMDVARQEGLDVEPHVLQAALGIPVVAMTAASNQGIGELLDAIAGLATGKVICSPNKPDIRADHQTVLAKIQAIIGAADIHPYPAQWVALKLLEGDTAVTAMMHERLSPIDWEQAQELLRCHEDAGLAIASGRYEWIGRMVRAAVVKPRDNQVTISERLDRVATHPVWGIGVLSVMLALIFGLTSTVGAPIQARLANVVVAGLAQTVAELLSGAPSWLSGLIVSGVIGGAGSMLTFIPILVIFFATLAILEDVGYMARAAFVMDRFMHPMGLHGKSFLPLFLGFGCNVPAVQGARIVEEPRARLLTMLVAPLVPCTARMAVVAFIAPLFFGSAATLVSWGLIMLNLIVLGTVGFVLSKTAAHGEPLAFIMELPLYHKPHLRSIALLVWQRCLSFVRRAGSLILYVSVIVWALSWFPNGSIETSFLAAVGRMLSPLGQAMGLNWQAMVALLTSFVAKENAIATMGVLLGSGAQGGLAQALPQLLSPAAALAFLVAESLFIPCLATVAVMRQETNSWRWTLLSVTVMLVVSFAAGIGVFQVLRLYL